MVNLQDLPPKYWFQILDRYKSNNSGQVKRANHTCLETIQKFVKPRSILVVNLNAHVCSYDILQSLRHLYPVIVTTEGLQRHDSPFTNVMDNLKTIWEGALTICEEAQYFGPKKMKYFITSQMWTRKFGDKAFEMLLEQMKSHKVPSNNNVLNYLDHNLYL